MKEEYMFKLYLNFMMGTSFENYVKENPCFSHLEEIRSVLQIAAENGIDFTTCEVSTSGGHGWFSKDRVIRIAAKGGASLKNLCRLQDAVNNREGWEAFLDDINLIEPND
jgi:thiamine biosynthesis protein ThiC